MAIRLTCSCGRYLWVKEEYAGKWGKCPACGEMLAIPLPEPLASMTVSSDQVRSTAAYEVVEDEPRPRARAERIYIPDEALQLHGAPVGWKIGAALLLLDAIGTGVISFRILSSPRIDLYLIIAAVVIAFLMALLAIGLFAGSVIAKWTTLVFETALAALIFMVAFKGLIDLRAVPQLRFVHDPRWLLLLGGAAIVVGWSALLVRKSDPMPVLAGVLLLLTGHSLLVWLPVNLHI